MSFGFGIGDLAICIRVSYTVYRALKDAPKECEILAKEILHLQSLLKRLRDDIEAIGKDTRAILPDRQPGPSEHGARCLELLLADIGGIEYLPLSASGDASERLILTERLVLSKSYPYSDLRHRFSQAKFFRKIPRLRAAVADIVNKVTAENVLISRYDFKATTTHRWIKNVPS